MRTSLRQLLSLRRVAAVEGQAGSWPVASAGRNLKPFKQIGHRRVETPCDGLQRDNPRLALAMFHRRKSGHFMC